MAANKPNNRQGAIRKKQKTPRKTIAWGSIFAKAKVLLVVAVVLSGLGFVSIGVFNQAQSLLATPISSVEVQGVLKYQDKKAIKIIVNKYAAKGFMKTNLKALQQELLALPWIAKAVIKRKPDNALELVLEEEKVLAVFNKKSLVNQYGELITPKTLPENNGLLAVFGDSHEKALNVLQDVQPHFAKQNQQIKSLHLKGNRSVSVQLENGVWVSLYETNIEQQMQRFAKVLEQGLKGNLAQVASIDLRYKNGAAVAWQETSMAYLGAK